MLCIEPTTTAEMLISELNRWLRFKRSVANDASELPTLKDLSDHVKSLLNEAAKRSAFQEEINSFSKNESVKAGYPLLELHPDVELQTMLRCEYTRSSDDKWVVRISSEFPNNENRTIEEFDIYVATIDDGTGKERLYPTSVSRNGNDVSILSWYQAAAALQISVEPDIFKRWMSMDDGYRACNPICPQCGASIKEQCRERRDQPMHCYECEWDSFKKYDHPSELGYDLKAFKKEQRYIRQSREYWMQRNFLFNTAGESIDGISTFLTKDFSKFESPSSIKTSLSDLISKLQAINDKIRYFR